MIFEGFNSTGTFDVTLGQFTTVSAATSIESIPVVATNSVEGGRTYAYVLSALMLPGTDLNGADASDTYKIHFDIDNNHYHITPHNLLNTNLKRK